MQRLGTRRSPSRAQLAMIEKLACAQFDDSEDAGELGVARGLASAAACLP
jgi:hypothetical protein